MFGEVTAEEYDKYRGTCEEACEAAVAADPTLRLVRGHYFDFAWGMQAHWWTEKPDGTVHDPTKDQFPSKGTGMYEEFDGTAACENCGKEIREEDFVMCGHYPCCSDSCAMRLVGL